MMVIFPSNCSFYRRQVPLFIGWPCKKGFCSHDLNVSYQKAKFVVTQKGVHDFIVKQHPVYIRPYVLSLTLIMIIIIIITLFQEDNIHTYIYYSLASYTSTIQSHSKKANNKNKSACESLL